MSVPCRLALALLTLAYCSVPIYALPNGSGSKPSSSVNTDKWDLQSPNLRIEFDAGMKSRVIARFGGKDTVLGPFSASESLTSAKRTWDEFLVISHKRERITDGLGAGERLVLKGKSTPLIKTVTVTIYDAFPTLATFDVKYTNTGKAGLEIKGWSNNAYTLEAKVPREGPTFWSYQSGSYEARPDWVLPLQAGFHRENFQGMNATDYGGGTPIIDVWSKEVGLGVGHIETAPKLISLPVVSPDAAHAQVAVSSSASKTLKPSESFRTLRTFVSVHQGDYFKTLTVYRRLMEKQGFKMAKAPESAFGPIWCAWGYGRNVQPKQVYDTLPTVKRMGFTWVTFDDGWQDNYADWKLDPKKFPNGDADMKAIVDRIHKDGFLAQLWWAPMMTAPNSKLIKEHPELALLNRDGSYQKISWWDTYYLCPTNKKVIDMNKELVRKIMVDWGFDGLKLDGQYMNAAPPCYNPAHHHARPEESAEGMPGFFKVIFDVARSLNPQALVEFCPCGTAYSFFTMPNYNMSVASDPSSSFQVRTKGKTLKGLMGDGVPYFGDHVELSDHASDFASTLGIGGVVGSQFVLPALAEAPSTSDLTPERERDFTHWLQIYKEKMLSRGQYLGELYDIGFDRPEAHAIKKGEATYFAFFAKQWNGPIELRGLGDRSYKLLDYEHNRELGQVQGPRAVLPVTFEGHLLVEAVPVDK